MQSSIVHGSWFPLLKAYLNAHAYTKVCYIIDEKVAGLHSLPDEDAFFITAHETHKSVEKAIEIWRWLSDSGADRKSLVVAIGGGLTTDLGGYVAANYMRGIDFVFVPTTLLAMVDASIGGKTGINLNHIKNRVGVFEAPKEIILDDAFLTSLDDIQIKSGFAEVIKASLFYRKSLFEKLLQYKSLHQLKAQFGPIIREAGHIKNEIVRIDPFEKAERKLLNVGHTIGHAIESLLLEKNQEVPHGFAVAAGIWIELKIATDYYRLPADHYQTVHSYLKNWYEKLPLQKKDWPQLKAYMLGDKKNESGKINFSLIKELGMGKINIYPAENIIESAFYSYVNAY